MWRESGVGSRESGVSLSGESLESGLSGLWGLWTLDSGLWTLESGVWSIDHWRKQKLRQLAVITAAVITAPYRTVIDFHLRQKKQITAAVITAVITANITAVITVVIFYEYSGSMLYYNIFGNL